MAVPFLTPARTVLLIGDEALYVYKVSHNAVKLLDNVPWQMEDFEETVVRLIRKDGGGKPVLIVNDMTDQHFKGGQRLPKVGAMDKGNVLKRKLQVSFPNYPIRGALPIKAMAEDGKAAKQQGSLFLFAAVPVSEQIVKTLEAVKLSMASIAGFVLLPVESSDMVRALSAKVAGKSRAASRWVVFIGQHQNGALRQVITRDGQLAMTRMTPVSDADADPQTWAQEVGQEFKATISYLSRFGYSANETTDVIVIADQPAGDILEKLIDIPCNYSSFTAPEAARLLGSNIGLQEEPRYAEPIHMAWAGRKSKFILPMDAAEIQKIHKPRQMVAAAMFLLILSGGFLAWQLSGLAQKMLETKNDLAIQQDLLAQAESEYTQEVQRMEALGFDVNLIHGTIKTYESFEDERLPILSLIREIGEGLGNEMRLDQFTISEHEGARSATKQGVYQSVKRETDQEEAKTKLEARLSLSFPPTIELEFGIESVNELQRKLRNNLPDYEVDIARQVARPEYTENIKGETGLTAQEIAAKEDYTAEIVIWGPR